MTIRYENTTPAAWRTHLEQILNTQIAPEKLSQLLPVKHYEKFDDYVEQRGDQPVGFLRARFAFDPVGYHTWRPPLPVSIGVFFNALSLYLRGFLLELRHQFVELVNHGLHGFGFGQVNSGFF